MPDAPRPSAGRRLIGYAGRFRGFDPDARRFVAASALIGIASSIYWVDFNLYLLALGFDAPTIGLLASIGSAAAALVAFPASVVADRLGRRAVLVGTGILATASLAGFAVSTSLLPLAILVFAWNVAIGGAAIVQGPFLAERSDDGNRSELFSLLAAVQSVTSVAAAVVGGLATAAIARYGDFDPDGPEPLRLLFLGTAAATLAGTFVLAGLAPDRPAATARSRREGAPARVGAGRFLFLLGRLEGDRGRFLRLLIPGTLISFGAGQIIPFLNLYVKGRFGLDVAELNAVFAVTALGNVVAILVQPALATRLGKVTAVVVVQAASIPFIVVLGFSPVLWTVVAALWVRSSLMVSAGPIWSAFQMEQLPPADRATFSATTSLIWSSAWVVGGWYYALVQARLGFDLGYAVGFLTMIALYVSAIACSWRWWRPIERVAARVASGAAAGVAAGVGAVAAGVAAGVAADQRATGAFAAPTDYPDPR